MPLTDVAFADDAVSVGGRTLPFAELARLAYFARVSLSATGFYRTPKIGYDRKTWSGKPFYYFCYGAAVSEVVVDTLTGENRLLRVDILHDVGRSLNPAIDMGQIEGGFIQGMGWLTMEHLWWNERGKLMTHAPSTYKIPRGERRAPVFNVKIFESGINAEDTIHRSKAVGEPPLMLAISVHRRSRTPSGQRRLPREPTARHAGDAEERDPRRAAVCRRSRVSVSAAGPPERECPPREQRRQ